LPSGGKVTAGDIKGSVRAYFIEDYSHGFYNTNSLLRRVGMPLRTPTTGCMTTRPAMAHRRSRETRREKFRRISR
jgi:hypothetical protein